jgi:hypothetical protein
MYLPENTKLIDEFNDTGHYMIDGNTTNIFPFIVYGSKFTRLDFAHSRFHDRQHLTLEIWFSREPNGDVIFELPPNFQRFHPTGNQTTYIFYPEDLDWTTRETEMTDVLFTDEVSFDYDRIETNTVKGRTKDFQHGYRIARLNPVGTYFINIRNLMNLDNGYLCRISRDEMPR